MKKDTIYDISVTLGSEAVDYPGDTPFSRKWLCKSTMGAPYNLSTLAMSAHSGTHIDIPLHFLPNGPGLETYAAADFIMPATVVEIYHPQTVLNEECRHLTVGAGEALLFKTRNSRSGLCRNGHFSDDFVTLSQEAADFCVSQKLALVGLDYITVEKEGDATFPIHHQLLGNHMFILEGIDLDNVPPGRYTLCCLPLKMKGAEASPVRAILLAEEK